MSVTPLSHAERFKQRVKNRGTQPPPPAVAVDPVLRMSQVAQVVGLSRSTIYRLISENQFPPGIALGGYATGWRASAINAWLDQRPQR